MATLNLTFESIADPTTRENFLKISEFINEAPFLIGKFKYYEIEFTRAETNKKIPHRLGFKPTFVVQGFVGKYRDLGPSTVTWNYHLFDTSNLDVTTSGGCTVHVIIGRIGQTGA